jgi:hypothetical protein
MPFIGNGEFPIKVVGESFYEDNLYSLCGSAADHVRQFAKTAILTLEGDNPYDRNAIRVDVEGLQVGHLSREDAARFRRVSGAGDGARFSCPALLLSLRGNVASDYGVRLDLDF